MITEDQMDYREASTGKIDPVAAVWLAEAHGELKLVPELIEALKSLLGNNCACEVCKHAEVVLQRYEDLNAKKG